MVEPSKYFKLKIQGDEKIAIIMALRQKEIYSRDLLYRAFAIDRNGDKAARIEEIVRRGTDRTSNEKRRGINLTPEHQKELRLFLEPSEYLYAAEESEIKEQINCMDGRTRDIFVLVYDNTKMLGLNKTYCFKFKDKERPQDALIALIELEYKAVREGW